MTTLHVVNPKGGTDSIDTDVLRDALDRWKGVCNLAATLVMELEEAQDDPAKRFATQELWHHAVSDYTLEVQRELEDLINDLEATK